MDVLKHNSMHKLAQFSKNLSSPKHPSVLKYGYIWMSEVTGVIVITRETDNLINVKSRYCRDSHRHERLARFFLAAQLWFNLHISQLAVPLTQAWLSYCERVGGSLVPPPMMWLRNKVCVLKGMHGKKCFFRHLQCCFCRPSTYLLLQPPGKQWSGCLPSASVIST